MWWEPATGSDHGWVVGEDLSKERHFSTRQVSGLPSTEPRIRASITKLYNITTGVTSRIDRNKGGAETLENLPKPSNQPAAKPWTHF